MSEQSQPYPGDNATVQQVLLLAEEYWMAAGILSGIGRRKHALSRAPYHMAAIHAIELYLNALLISEGLEACDVRKLRHDLAERIKHPSVAKLGLRKTTIKHLNDVCEQREYQVSRYGAEQMKDLSQVNQLEATLVDIRTKVAKLIGGKTLAAKPCATAEECTTAKSSAAAMSA